MCGVKVKVIVVWEMGYVTEVPQWDVGGSLERIFYLLLSVSDSPSVRKLCDDVRSALYLRRHDPK